MKKTLIMLCFFLIIFSCEEKSSTEKEEKKVSKISKHEDFSNYWYDGFAEITSYKLTQSRYGEIHEGTAVNIFVTEDFLPEKQVKADDQNESNVSVLKLNATKKFTTGIYPYSIMTSSFTPVDLSEETIKISFSMQEWCGNTYMQMNNRDDFNINFYSYFESNTDQQVLLEKEILENEIWNRIRINPKSLPDGSQKLIPSLEYLSMYKKDIKAYDAKLSLEKSDSTFVYKINYEDLNRTLEITFSNKAPFLIDSWTETISINGNNYTTKAEKLKTIKSKYWSKNLPTDKYLRDSLSL